MCIQQYRHTYRHVQKQPESHTADFPGNSIHNVFIDICFQLISLKSAVCLSGCTPSMNVLKVHSLLYNTRHLGVDIMTLLPHYIFLYWFKYVIMFIKINHWQFNMDIMEIERIRNYNIYVLFTDFRLHAEI